MEEVKHDDLYRLRHSLAHVLAQAVLQIRPKSKLAFGPPIDTGCYYDFEFPEPLTPEDFADIEKRMRKIIAEKQEFVERKLPLKEALTYLEKRGENFKVEFCQELGGQGEKEIGFFQNGPFDDMCRGPHLKHTGEIPPDCFKIDTLAGAYWRGNEKNPQLTRIYVLAFKNKAELKDYVDRRELAKQRDHRKLGKELELFMISDHVGPGLPLWMPNGAVIREELEAFAKETEQRYGYQKVCTPHLAKEELYLTSGHLPFYKDTMFPPMKLEGESDYYLKAMNCPHHHMIYGFRPRSYRELPMRLAEYGTVYRFEPSGTLAGLLRVRSLAMNDAHIYCTLEQTKAELKANLKMTYDYYKMFRFEGIRLRLSLHDPKNKEKFIDNPTAWEFTERVLKEIVEEEQVNHVVGEGEAAFYGPKLDFQAKTLLGREETISTTQLDFAASGRFNLKYIGEDGSEHPLYVVHRAPLGTHERFLAFLIEHFGGAFPTWMAPIQARLIPINEACMEFALKLQQDLQQQLIRVEVDKSDNSFNKKIREAVTHKIPNMAIIGNREVEQGKITLRRYCTEEQLSLDRAAFIDRMIKLKRERIMDNFEDLKV